MKKTLLWAVLSLAFVAQARAAEPAVPATPATLAPQPEQGQAATLAAEFFSRYHYKPTPLDDAMSAKVFDRYLKTLDPDRLFFLKSDIDNFSYSRNDLDDAILARNLQIPFSIFNIYQKRLAQRMGYARELLKTGFDFKANETYQTNREKEPWVESEEQMRELWRKRVKNDWLRLKLGDNSDKVIRETLEKRYNNLLSRAYKYKSDDVFQIFMTSYSNSIEPHTDYLGPRASADFDISMSLSLVGIGAVLQERDDYATIRELVPGAPAALSAKIAVGDRIVAVGQGNDGPMTEVVGWRVDDVVALIRGSLDSVVRLDILAAGANPDSPHKLVSLVRARVSLEKQAARKTVIQVKNGNVARNIGIITLPTFYQDTEARSKGDRNYRSATRDVITLLEDLKKDKVDGVILDLRNNGGGSLDEAVELTTAFAGRGPVVQIRNSQGGVKIESSKAGRQIWGGPLGVMVNRGSASASEIFAAAIQDYGRGVIIGEPSFGKGTVQSLVNLDEIAHNEKPKYGELKMTIAQFFRINGGTTQLRGVTPDIAFPIMSDNEAFGESSYENALPYTQIKPASYTAATDIAAIVPQLQGPHAARIAKDKEFQYLIDDINEVKALRKKKVVSLNEAERRRERDAQEAKLKQRTKASQVEAKKKPGKNDPVVIKKSTTADNGLLADERSLTDELAAEKAAKEAKDPWLEEAAQIIGDEAGVMSALATARPGARAASATQAMPAPVPVR